MAVAILALGCQASPSGSPSGSELAQASGSPTSGTASQSPTGPGATATPGVPTSEDLIAAALAAGTIDYPTSLLDRAYALFDSPGLPDNLRSPRPDMGAGTELSAEIDAHESELPADVLARLAPFRVRPSDPTSIFSTGLRRTASVRLAAATTTPWASAIAVPGEARVWVLDRGDAAVHLPQHVADVAKVWAAYQDVFTNPDADQPGDPNASVNPDNLVDFYFVDAFELDPRQPACSDADQDKCSLSSAGAAGMARPTSPHRANASSAYFVLDSGRRGDAALFELAHELAHGGQFHYDNQESTWLAEASANWAAYRVFQKLQIYPAGAYTWLPGFFSHLEQPLTTEGDQASYEGWPFFQFAAMQRGDKIVADIWQAAGRAGPDGANAVDRVVPFADNFGPFAVQNWNQAPVPHRYRTAPDPTFPDLTPNVRLKNPAMKAGDKVKLPTGGLPHLASAYYVFGFDDSARKLTFDNRLQGLDGAHVWAIREVNGDWQEPEDWTSSSKKTFCRDVPAEDLSTLVLVVSYAKLVGSLDNGGTDPTLAAEATGCGGWQGTMTATRNWDTPSGKGSGSARFEGVWSAETDPIVPCQGNPFGACSVFVPSGTIKWTWQSTWKDGSCSENRSGSVAAGSPRIITTQILVLAPTDDPKVIQYWAQGGFDLPGLTCTDPISAGKGQTSFIDLSEDDSASNTVGAEGRLCHSMSWQIDPTATTISGSCFAWNNAFNSLEFDWNLTRIGPPPG